MDLYKECNDKNLLKEDEFEATFCRVCKNRKCERAGYAKSTWDERIGSQLSRLILNPNLLTNTKGTQWEPLPDFDSIMQEFRGYEVWGVPQTEQPKPPLIEVPTPETLPPPPPQEELPEITPEPVVYTTPPPMPAGQRVRVLNTDMGVGEGLWIGGASEEPKIILPNQVAQDPWEVPMKVGSTFKMKG